MSRVGTAAPRGTMSETDGSPLAGLRPDRDVVAQRLGDDVVLIHLRSNRIYEMNATAARVWELLGEGAAEPRILEALSAEFDVADDQLRAELARLVTTLRGHGLLTADDVG